MDFANTNRSSFLIWASKNFKPKIQKTPGFLDFGLNFFEAYINNRLLLVFAKSIFTSILKVSDKFIEKCRRSKNLVNDTWAK